MSNMRSSTLNLIRHMTTLCQSHKVDATYRIEETLEALYSDEPLMYWRIKRYRDHLYHTCRVALLGIDLLDAKYPLAGVQAGSIAPFELRLKIDAESTARPLWRTIYDLMPHPLIISVNDTEHVRLFPQNGRDAMPDAVSYDRNQSYAVDKPSLYTDNEIEDFVKRIWLIASLKHDIGYSLTYLRELIERSDLLKLGQCSSIDFVRAKMHGAFADIFRRLRVHATSLESPMREVHTLRVPHGVVGALHVKSLKGDEYVLELAARAIARHDDDSRQVRFETEPLSWLLLLCDELQEWGRPVKVFQERSETHAGTASLSLVARSELDALLIERPCATNDFITRVVFDYTDNRSVLEFETGFFFPAFIYAKQRNLSRLVGGPRFSLRFQCDDVGRQDGSLIERQFAAIRAWAVRESAFTLSNWCNNAMLPSGVREVIDIGHHGATGDGTLMRPPEIAHHIGSYLDRMN